MQKVLQIDRLTKHYGRIRAIHELTVDVEKGQVFGILGPNGSGKTTTLSLIMGVIPPQSGTYSWFGNRPSENGWKKTVGCLIEIPNFYPYLSLVENLKIVAGIKDVPVKDIDRVLELTRLYERKHSPFRTLSLGMKQRLAMASVLLGDPQVLVLDEPTNGLDPEGIAEVREIISREAQRGKTVILASHILAEVEKVCTHVAVLKAGTLLASGRVEELLAADRVFRLTCGNAERLESLLKGAGLIRSAEHTGHDLVVTCDMATTAEEINRFAFENGIVLSGLVTVKKSLETQFLELVK